MSFDGSTIINIDKLVQYTRELASHSSKCNGSVTLAGEKRNGVASIIHAQCSTRKLWAQAIKVCG